MHTLYEVCENPSGLDSYSNYAGQRPERDLYVVLTRSRDSDVLMESNWECALALLGGEVGNVEIYRFGHWACGWWEALCVRKCNYFGIASEAFRKGEEICDDLESYPVLDDDDFIERETIEADRVWSECYNWSDRVEYVRNFRDMFEFNDREDMLHCIQGKYFSGYASELIN